MDNKKHITEMTELELSVLRERIGEEAYKVLIQGGTEMPFSGEYHESFESGSYTCKICGNKLFSSEQKYHSDQLGLRGWPSFDEAILGSVKFSEDRSMGMYRTEVTCAQCGAHLGHVFTGDPESKTDTHYCINSVCLDFTEAPQGME